MMNTLHIILAGKVDIEKPPQRRPVTTKVHYRRRQRIESLATLTVGSTIGEEGLKADYPAPKNMRSTTTTYLASITRVKFRHIMRNLDDDILASTINTLKEQPMFLEWTEGSLTKLAYYFTEETVPRKTVLYEQG